jgi:RNA polymerase sigma factor (sigma-70 family)
LTKPAALNNSQYDHTSDEELLEAFYRQKDNHLLGVLLQRYTLLLLGVCMKYLKNEDDAKDSVQQIFLKAITELHKYKVTYIKSWLYMVAKNHCLMKLRDRSHHPETELTDRYTSGEEEDTKLEQVEKDKLLSLMEETLPQLNEEQKTCVTLFYLQKQSYQQIADTTGFSLMQVKSYIQNGKRNLRVLIQKKLNATT